MATKTITPKRIARKLYMTSPEALVRTARHRIGPMAGRDRGTQPVTREFLLSGEYEELMNRFVPCDGQYGLHEAETATKSFMFRAFKAHGQLRAYRWRGIQENLTEILELIDDPDKLVVDLGGAASPFDLGSVIVDRLEYDVDGNKVQYKTLDELPRKADVIISSHTLEHIPDLEGELDRIKRQLTEGGHLIALLPAYTCVRWRSGVHSHANYGDHVWTFGLSGDPNVPEGLVNYVEVDKLLERFFAVEKIEFCGDDSIFAICRRD